MGKLLLLVVVVLLVYWVVKAFSRGLRKQDEPPRQAGAEDMVRCDQCGVHLPRSESVTSQGKFFCSDDHRRQRLG
ncbi:MAG: preprotein translocase subunit YajC [Betaproteobacteria bacterium]|nr:preprotein translocase subunit YajC [Betaproteobacteria bacterium]